MVHDDCAKLQTCHLISGWLLQRSSVRDSQTNTRRTLDGRGLQVIEAPMPSIDLEKALGLFWIILPHVRFRAEDPDGEDSPEEGQIEVEPRKKKKKMRPAKVKRMQARQAAKQAEIDLVNSVASERGLASPPGTIRQEEGSQRKVLNTGKGLVVVASR